MPIPRPLIRGAAGLLLAAATMLVAPPATAALQGNPFDAGSTATIAWPGGTPTRALVGDFTGDHLVDVVFLLEGGGATLVYGPGYHSAFVPLPPTVRDAARLSATPPGTDALLVLDATGLALVQGYSGGAFSSTPIPSGPLWLDARRVVCGDVDLDGRGDAVGVAADGTTILVSSDVAGVAGPSSFELPHEVLDLAIVDWSPAPAIVALTTGGVYVRKWDGSFVAELVGATLESGALTGFREAGLAHERVAAVFSVPGEGDYLAAFDVDGPAGAIPLGGIGAFGLASGDVDGDGLGDLVVVQRQNLFGLLLRNQDLPGAAFGPIEGIDCGLGPLPAATQTGFPAVADLTNDGDLDFLVHVDAAEELVLVENASAPDAEPPRVLGGYYAYSYEQVSGILNLRLQQGGPLAFAPTAIEVTLWAQVPPDPEDPDGPPEMDPQARFHRLVPLDGLGEGLVAIELEGETDPATAAPYHLELRAVRAQGGAIVQVGPTAVWSFATPASDVLSLELAYGTEGVPLRIFLVDENRYMTDEEEDERILTPSTVQGSKVPPIDEPPDPFAD